MNDLIAVWVSFGVCNLVCSGLFLYLNVTDPLFSQRFDRYAARALLLSPVWPLLYAVVTIWLIVRYGGKAIKLLFATAFQSETMER